MKKIIATTIFALKEVAAMIDKAREVIEPSENLSAADLLIVALLAADKASDYLIRAVQFDRSGNEVDAAYYCKKAKIMTHMAYRHAELAIKEAELSHKGGGVR